MMDLNRIKQKVSEKLEKAIDALNDPVALILAYGIFHSICECDPKQICKRYIKNVARRLKQLINDIRACTNYDDVESVRECLEEILQELESEINEVLKQ